MAVMLEGSLVQLHMDQVARFSTVSYQQLFRAMMAADQDHVERLRTALQEHRG